MTDRHDLDELLHLLSAVDEELETATGEDQQAALSAQREELWARLLAAGPDWVEEAPRVEPDVEITRLEALLAAQQGANTPAARVLRHRIARLRHLLEHPESL